MYTTGFEILLLMIASSHRPPRRSGTEGIQTETDRALPSGNASYRLGSRTSGPSGTGPLSPGSHNAFHHLAGILVLKFF